MSDAPRLVSTWFDGHSPRAQDCELRIEGTELVLSVDGGEHRYPVRQVRWAERRSHGQRQSELPDGSLIQHANAGEWDGWRHASGQRYTRAKPSRCAMSLKKMRTWAIGFLRTSSLFM